MICRQKLYDFIVANLLLPQRASSAVKRVFATVKWYKSFKQIVLSHNDNNNEHFDELKL